MHYSITVAEEQYLANNALLEGELGPVGTQLDQVDHHARRRSLDVVTANTGKGVHPVIISEYAGAFCYSACLLPAIRSTDRFRSSILPFETHSSRFAYRFLVTDSR